MNPGVHLVQRPAGRPPGRLGERSDPVQDHILLAGLLRGSDPPVALALGCAVGAASTQGIGGTGSSPELTAALALARDVTVRPWP